MPSRLSARPNNSSLLISLGIHGMVVVIFVAFSFAPAAKKEKVLEFSVVEKIKVAPEPEAPPVVNIEKPTPPPPPKPSRQVFGVSKKSITSTSGEAVKVGNTVAKAVDDLELEESDEASLPIPADEFLVTAMPTVLEEIRPEYPAAAKRQGVQGRVVFEIIIDDQGAVRQAVLVQSLGEEFDQAARQAMMRFRFRPGMMNNQAVAVKIRYAINFKLE